MDLPSVWSEVYVVAVQEEGMTGDFNDAYRADTLANALEIASVYARRWPGKSVFVVRYTGLVVHVERGPVRTEI